MKISCELRITADLGSASFLQPDKKALPPGKYNISYGYAENRKQWISDNLKNIGTRELKKNQIKKLKLAVVKALDNNYLQDSNIELSRQTNEDLAGNRGIKSSTALVLKKEKGFNVRSEDFFIKLHQIDSEIFEAETNLGEIFSLDELEVHKVVQQAIFGIANLNKKIAEMELHNSLSVFLEDDAPLFEDRLEFLVQSISPHNLEKNFNRVCRVQNFPNIISMPLQTIDVERLLEVRTSEEIKVFRDWLRKIDNVSDDEIKEQLNNIRSKLGVIAQGDTSKASKLLISTLAGSVPGIGTIAGLSLGAIDAFLLEKIVPYSGVVAFTEKLYPSIFKSQT